MFATFREDIIVAFLAKLHENLLPTFKLKCFFFGSVQVAVFRILFVPIDLNLALNLMTYPGLGCFLTPTEMFNLIIISQFLKQQSSAKVAALWYF